MQNTENAERTVSKRQMHNKRTVNKRGTNCKIGKSDISGTVKPSS